MINRRVLLQITAASVFFSKSAEVFAQAPAEDELLVPIESPPISDLTSIHPFGSHPASREEIARAKKIISNTPTGPRPIDIAASFYERYYNSDPHVISQWPVNEAWNPLIATFFSATNKDTVAWCAAFVNWCLERGHRPTTKSSASQSFATTKLFRQTSSPVEGDIAVFTCYEPGTNSSLGLGHVAFYKGPADSKHILVLGGNQSGKKPSIISVKTFPIAFQSSRTINGKRVPVDYRLNRFLHVV